MKYFILFFLVFQTHLFADENKVKTCLAAQLEKWRRCQDVKSKECLDSKKSLIEPNCQNIETTTFPLSGKPTSAIIISRTKDDSFIWILETETKTMIKVK